jgi:glyoxylase-like metal-dependent hydrolase (beta-lactamase superfamily II)
VVGIMTSVTLGLAFSALAGDVKTEPLKLHKLTPNVYWVEGGGGNSGIVVGNRGVILIDAKGTEDIAKELLQVVANLTPKPVTTAIFTHSDEDHIGGLQGLPSGIEVLEHRDNWAEQAAALSDKNSTDARSDRGRTPVLIAGSEERMIDGVKLELLHWGPAHTRGDLVVYIPGEYVVFTGDIFILNVAPVLFPMVHDDKAGSAAGWIATARGIMALDASVFVPGHGDPQPKAPLEKLVTAADAKRAEITRLFDAGTSIQDIKIALGDQLPGDSSAPPWHHPATYTEIVYDELRKRKQ